MGGWVGVREWAARVLLFGGREKDLGCRSRQCAIPVLAGKGDMRWKS